MESLLSTISLHMLLLFDSSPSVVMTYYRSSSLQYDVCFYTVWKGMEICHSAVTIDVPPSLVTPFLSSPTPIEGKCYGVLDAGLAQSPLFILTTLISVTFSIFLCHKYSNLTHCSNCSYTVVVCKI